MKLLKKLYSIHSKSGKEQKMIKFLLWWIKTNVPGARVELDHNIGNIYVTKGVSDTYPCIVSHIDQVQSIHSRDFQAIETKDIIFGYSPKNKRLEGLGADDKNGVWVCLKCLMKYENIKVAFFVGEEVGCIGSSKADMDFFKDVRFVIQCDRRGSNDLIASICSSEIASKEFIEATGHEQFGYHLEEGMMTDVLTLKENGLAVSCVNLSCGYYDPHSDHEFTIKKDLLNCLSFVEHIIENCTGTYQHQCDYSMGFYDDYLFEYYDEIY
ncbi:MAG: hypothetical protein IJV11_07190 [Muribaculaceae bacterium]|nr:hypothetical protein [Muribaculaceae bacterium]